MTGETSRPFFSKNKLFDISFLMKQNNHVKIKNNIFSKTTILSRKPGTAGLLFLSLLITQIWIINNRYIIWVRFMRIIDFTYTLVALLH